MAAVKNHFHDEIERNAILEELGPDDPTECEDCDGFGMCWNNADPTSGQWAACETCGDTRGHP